MKKTLIFDTGPIISLTLNNLLWILKPLKDKFEGDFVITKSVKRELVDNPLKTKKFKLEAMQTTNYIKNNYLKVHISGKIKKIAEQLIDLANNSFYTRGKPIQIVQYAEIESLALAQILKASLVIDERTTRKMIEAPEDLLKLLEKKLHSGVSKNETNLKKFKNLVKDVKVIRSTELVYAAFKLGILDPYLAKKTIKEKKELLDAALWALKLRGCAIRENEILEIIKDEFALKT